MLTAPSAAQGHPRPTLSSRRRYQGRRLSSSSTPRSCQPPRKLSGCHRPEPEPLCWHSSAKIYMRIELRHWQLPPCPCSAFQWASTSYSREVWACSCHHELPSRPREAISLDIATEFLLLLSLSRSGCSLAHHVPALFLLPLSHMPASLGIQRIRLAPYSARPCPLSLITQHLARTHCVRSAIKICKFAAM